jgi:hypothetical protein
MFTNDVIIVVVDVTTDGESASLGVGHRFGVHTHIFIFFVGQLLGSFCGRPF